LAAVNAIKVAKISHHSRREIVQGWRSGFVGALNAWIAISVAWHRAVSDRLFGDHTVHAGIKTDQTNVAGVCW
jgi:hypothetical protein